MSLLEGIANDTEFCTKLAREESVIVLPGKLFRCMVDNIKDVELQAGGSLHVHKY